MINEEKSNIIMRGKIETVYGYGSDPGPRQLGTFSSPVDSPFPPLVKGTRGASRAGEESEKEAVV